MRMKPHFVLSMLLIFMFGISHVQWELKDFPVLKGPYLGQVPPAITPELFNTGIIDNKVPMFSIQATKPNYCCAHSRAGNTHSFNGEYKLNIKLL